MSKIDTAIYLDGFDDLDFAATVRPGASVIKITVTYSDNVEADYVLGRIQRAHEAMKTSAARRKEEARAATRAAARAAKSGRKSTRQAAIGRSAPLLMIPHFPPEDEA